jgi:Protein of unknown function (DUF3617)
MRGCVTILLNILIMVGCPAIFAQVASTNQPLQLKEGWWELSTTNIISAKIPEDMLAQLTPEQREGMLAALKEAQTSGETQRTPLCLSHEHLVSGDILGTNAGCTTQRAISSGQKLEISLQCASAQRSITIERASATSFKGSESIITPNVSNVNSTFSATWMGADCAAARERPVEADNTPRMPQEPDREVLSFMPNPPERGWLGRYVAYVWTKNDPVPYVEYMGNAPGVPILTLPHVYFHGTDGNYIYMTLVAAGTTICIPQATLLRVDRSGQIAVVNRAPEGLHGGARLPYYCDGGKPTK